MFEMWAKYLLPFVKAICYLLWKFLIYIFPLQNIRSSSQGFAVKLIAKLGGYI